MRFLSPVFLLFLTLPAVAAQEPVERCMDSCRPEPANLVRSTDADTTVEAFLYGHTQNALMGAYLTTQVPSPEIDPTIDHGYLMPTLQTDLGTPADFNFRYDFRLQPNTGLIEVREGNYRTSSYGTFSPVGLGAGPIRLFAYFSADASPQGQSGQGVVPGVRVEATWLYLADDRTTKVFAQATSAPFDMMSGPGGSPVYEVGLTMEPESSKLPGYPDTDRTYLVVRTYQLSQGPVEFGQSQIRIRAGVDHPWRLILPVKNALSSEAPMWTRTGDGPELEWGVLSPFGAYDVDASSVRLRIVESDGHGREVMPTRVDIRTNYHGWEYAPVPFVWSFPTSEIASLKGASGELVARNLQGTFELVQSVEFNADLLQPLEVPGPAASILILAGAVACLVARRLQSR